MRITVEYMCTEDDRIWLKFGRDASVKARLSFIQDYGLSPFLTLQAKGKVCVTHHARENTLVRICLV